MDVISRSALFSDDRLHRYRLARWWGSGPRVTFVLLNPSDADEANDDPTMRRCRGFAEAWGCEGFEVVNLYAFCTPYPNQLWLAKDPVGPANDEHLEQAVLSASGPVVAGWVNEARADRVKHVLGLRGFKRLQALQVNKGGAPRHPLYVRGSTVPAPWPRRLERLSSLGRRQ
jgi:hypothetical protein